MTKNDSEAVVNVNLARCTCAHSVLGGAHAEGCPATHVLVPLSLEPWRTFTMKVRLGECDCLSSLKSIGTHTSGCRSRPTEATCPIRGKTWAESDVADVELASPYVKERIPQGTIDTYGQICRARWALIKALVLGFDVRDPRAPSVPTVLSTQRDAMYADITELFRVEQTAAEIQQRALKHLGAPNVWIDYGGSPGHPVEVDGRRASVILLRRYVEGLIEQIGALA